MDLNKIYLGTATEHVSLSKSNNLYTALTSEGYTRISCGPQYIERDVLEKDFEEYFNIIYYDSDEEIWKRSYEFKHKTLDLYLTTSAYSLQVSNPLAESSVRLGTIYHKPNVDIQEIIDYLNSSLTLKKNNFSKVSIILKSVAGFQRRSSNIEPQPVSIREMYNDDFEPIYDKIVDKLTNDSKGIVMLHGNPGTGKTNLIKYLTTIVTEKDFIFVPANMIQYLTDPSFLDFLLNNTESILVLEDCESYIKERGSGSNDAVSSLLNMSDGIMSDILKIQIICTFNGRVGSIDKALLRKGRLIAEYEFKELEKSKAQALADKLDVELPEKLTLTEIFNAKEKVFTSQKERTKIGFTT